MSIRQLIKRDSGLAGVMLLTWGLVASPQVAAQSALEIKSCKALIDDAQRLRCFDGLFAEKSAKSTSQPKAGLGSWSIDESKSFDASTQIAAVLAGKDGSVLALRCKEHLTDALFTKSLTYFGLSPIKVQVSVDDGQPIESMWSTSSDGQAAFVPSPIPFIRALTENGKLFIRAYGYSGAADGDFNLGHVSDVRNRIATACKWPDADPGEAASRPELSTGSVPLSPSPPR
jgi:hypothetical protein